MNSKHSISRLASVAALVIAVPMLSACGKKEAGGQVLATVNDEEVTRRELAAEPELSQIPPGADAQAVLPGVVDQVITRKVAVDAAKDLKLDQTPEYLAMRRRSDEVLLSRMLFERWAKDMPAPKQEAINAFITANPQMFQQRRMFLVDQLQTAAAATDAKNLEPLNTMDDIGGYLTKSNRRFQRQQTVLDTAKLSADFAKTLATTKPGYPIAISQGGVTTLFAVLQAKDAPVPSDKYAMIARAALTEKFVGEKLMDMRKKAKVTYQKGFEPKAAAAAASAPTAVDSAAVPNVIPGAVPVK